jgi:hypothetical protein
MITKMRIRKLFRAQLALTQRVRTNSINASGHFVMTITASETGSADNRASFHGELAMHFSCASTTKEVTATQGMSAIGTQARAWKAASIPDPLRLHREGIAIQSTERESAAIVFDWCKRAHECLCFLATTDPSRVWVWQEQVLPILLALSSTLAARRSIIAGERALPSVSTHGGKGRRATARQESDFGPTSADVTARAGAGRCRPQLRQRRKHQAARPKRDGQSDRAPPYRRGSRSPSPRGRCRTDARALRADAG